MNVTHFSCIEVKYHKLEEEKNYESVEASETGGTTALVY
jgi:hypothetical protein